MKLCLEDKNAIFSVIKSEFDFVTPKVISECRLFDECVEDRNLEEKGFEFFYGTVKTCIVHEDFSNWVVKMCIDTEFDYCEREYTNYLAASARNLDKYFPFTDYLGEINGVRFYIQEKAEVDEYAITSRWYSAIRDDYSGEETEEEFIQNDVWCMVENADDEERTYILFDNDELQDFLLEYCINDIHEGNLGFIGDSIVIIDFSGYGTRAVNRGF